MGAAAAVVACCRTTLNLRETQATPNLSTEPKGMAV